MFFNFVGENMSHFTLMVFGDNVDEQLEPFAEQTDNPKYTVFNDTEDEDLEEYQNKTLRVKFLPNGERTNEYDERFKVYGKNFDSSFVFPEGTETKEMKFCEYYTTFENYKEHWCGGSERDSIKNRYGYWRNPNAKWDWYSLGGRWTGFFKPKQGTSGELGRSGAFDNQPKAGWVDTIRLGDIDLDGMIAEARKDANLEYDKVEHIIAGRELPSWEKTVAKYDKDYQKAREEYNNHPMVLAFNEAKIHVWSGLHETYKGSREEYVKSWEDNVLVPFAILKDGQWHERGEMGWFGAVSDEKDCGEWQFEVRKMLSELDPNTIVSLMDCHI